MPKPCVQGSVDSPPGATTLELQYSSVPSADAKGAKLAVAPKPKEERKDSSSSDPEPANEEHEEHKPRGDSTQLSDL